MPNDQQLTENWRFALRDRSFRTELVLTVLIASAMVVALSEYFAYIQARPGVYLNDPVLQRIPPRNLSGYTFFLLYGSILFAFWQLANRPRIILQGIQVYCVIMTLRMITLYLVPLEPSPQMIPLRDPIIDYFIYENRMISKDLFFSGHVSTAFLMVLLVREPWQKILLGISTVIIAIMILVQHVHYTVDVVAAPVFTFISYYMVRKAHSKGLSLFNDLFRYLGS